MKDSFIKLLEKATEGKYRTTHHSSRYQTGVTIHKQIFDKVEDYTVTTEFTLFKNRLEGETPSLHVAANGYGSETFDLTEAELIKVQFYMDQIIEIDRKRGIATLTAFLTC